MYDKNNVFAKIVRGEIPSKRIYENAYALSFYDISPATTIHALIIPRGEYENILDFSANASDDEKLGFFDCTITNRNNGPAGWFFTRRIRNNDSAGGFVFFFDSLDKNIVI